MSCETNVDFGKLDILKLLNPCILFSFYAHVWINIYSLLPLFSSNIMYVTVFCFYGEYPVIGKRFVPMEE